MVRKFFRGLAIVLAVVVLLLIGLGIALGVYVQRNQAEFLAMLEERTGLAITYRSIDFTAWSTYPDVHLSVDSLTVRDMTRPAAEPPLLVAESLSGTLSLDRYRRDTLALRRFVLRGGGANVVRDSLGRPNFGRLGRPADTTAVSQAPGPAGWLNPTLDWQGVVLDVADFDLAYRYGAKHKRMRTYVDSLHVTAFTDPAGRLTFAGNLATHVAELGFNTTKGVFLEDAALGTSFAVVREDTCWRVAPTLAYVDGAPYGVRAEFGRAGHAGMRIHVDGEDLDYGAVLSNLPLHLRQRLQPFHVAGPFAASIDLTIDPANPKDPEAVVNYRVRNQTVRLRQYTLTNATASGTVVNRLPPAEGGVVGSKKNLRITVDSASCRYAGMWVTSPHALVRGHGKDLTVTAPVTISGDPRALSRQVGAENFLLAGGHFRIETRVDAPLADQDALIASADGRLTMRDPRVSYPAAGVVFPLRRLNVTKRDKDIRFDLLSDELATGFSFAMDGRLDNLLPLLLERPADSIRADVNFRAPRLDWTDFLAIFGDGGYLASDTTQADPAPVDASGMKAALLGLRSTFRPHIEARFDTLAYYDVLAVDDFRTGLRFDGDTLVLERTSFGWEDSRFTFGARLGLGAAERTPFRLSARAADLDLNRLRSQLEYFGLALPAGLDTLPRALDIDLVHRGTINDSLGIDPTGNRGRLRFADGRDRRFVGDLRYWPRAGRLQSRLHLAGDPTVVNRIFAAENFFFGGGRFRIDLALDGLPADVNEMLATAALDLRIDSSRVAYRTGGVFVPVRSLTVVARDRHVDYDLRLLADETRRAVQVAGTMDDLGAFLDPQPGRAFRMATVATAQTLHWSDFADFIRPDTAAAYAAPPAEGDAPAAEEAFELQRVVSTTGGVFNSFRPDLSVAIDTFYVDDTTLITDIRTGLHLRDSTRLVLDPSGFRFRGGRAEVAGSYDLDRRLRSPFRLNWRVDSLSLADLSEAAARLKLAKATDAPGGVRGTVHTNGELRGRLHEGRKQLLIDSTYGRLTYALHGIELSDWPQLRDLGRRMKMEKRFGVLRFAPLASTVVIDGGRLVLPQTEVQSTALQLFLEGQYDTLRGPDLLVGVPLRNIGRGLLNQPPAPTGFARAGWKVFLVVEQNKRGVTKTRLRLGRRKFYRQRGRLEELRELRSRERSERRAARKERSPKRLK